MRLLKNRYVQKALRLTFSNAGLCVLVTVYTVLGAALFQQIERDHEIDQNLEIDRHAFLLQTERERVLEKTIDLVRTCRENWLRNKESISDECHDDRGTAIIGVWLTDYHWRLIERNNATDGLYKGQLFLNQSEVLRRWTMPKAILFTTSILTTIGYGHITPSTEIGQMTVIMYAVLALPLMSMFLYNIASQLEAAFMWIRQKVMELVPCQSKIVPRWANRVGPAVEPEKTDDQKQHLPIILVVVISFLYNILGMLLFHATEQWPLVASLYFTFVSICTIGFGDYVPDLDTSVSGYFRMIMTTAFLFIGLAILAMCISLIIQAIKTSAVQFRVVLSVFMEKLKSKTK